MGSPNLEDHVDTAAYAILGQNPGIVLSKKSIAKRLYVDPVGLIGMETSPGDAVGCSKSRSCRETAIALQRPIDQSAVYSVPGAVGRQHGRAVATQSALRKHEQRYGGYA